MSLEKVFFLCKIYNQTLHYSAGLSKYKYEQNNHTKGLPKTMT